MEEKKEENKLFQVQVYTDFQGGNCRVCLVGLMQRVIHTWKLLQNNSILEESGSGKNFLFLLAFHLL